MTSMQDTKRDVVHESAGDEGRTSQEAGRLGGEEEIFSDVMGEIRRVSR